MKKFAKAIRIVTIAPLMALIFLLIMFYTKSSFFGSMHNFLLMITFIVIFPVLAYLLQPFIPKYKNQGREGQRNLAILMSGIGYLCGIISAVCFSATSGVWIIYLLYFFSGCLIILFNKVLKVRASGHACGVAGPIAAINYFIGKWAALGIIVWILACWASLAMQRHKKSELIIGSLIPIFALILSVAIVKSF